MISSSLAFAARLPGARLLAGFVFVSLTPNEGEVAPWPLLPVESCVPFVASPGATSTAVRLRSSISSIFTVSVMATYLFGLLSSTADSN